MLKNLLFADTKLTIKAYVFSTQSHNLR